MPVLKVKSEGKWIDVTGSVPSSDAGNIDLTEQIQKAESAAAAAEAAASSANTAMTTTNVYRSNAKTSETNAANSANRSEIAATIAEEAATRAEEAVASIPESGGGTVKTVNGVEPDENGNVEISIPGSGGNADQSSGLTTAQIAALDGMFKVCAYDDSKDVSGAYAAFKTAFGITDDSSGGEEPDEPVTPEKTLTSISATYSGGNVPVGTSVNALTGIVVKATYSDGSTATVTGYTLSGTIAEGSNTVTVSYGGKTTTFTVTGVAESGGDDSGETPEILYELTEPTVFDGTKSIDTGWNPYAEDGDFTIISVADFTGGTVDNEPIANVYQYKSEIYTLTMNYTNSVGSLTVAANQGGNGVQIDTGVYSYITAIAITHAKGSSVSNVKILKKKEPTDTYGEKIGEVPYTVVPDFSKTMTLGYNQQKNKYATGTINKFVIYSRVLTDEEISAQLA